MIVLSFSSEAPSHALHRQPFWSRCVKGGKLVIVLASGEVVSVASAAVVTALILVVGAFDYLVFTNIDTLAKRMKPASMVVSEVVFGILLTAVAIQLIVTGLGNLGIIAPAAAH